MIKKYSGAGNTFAILDNRQGQEDLSPHRLKKLSQDTDGVLFLEYGKKAPLAMRIFNKDGSEAEMCGNGLRCLYFFAKELGIIDGRTSFETKGGTAELELQPEKGPGNWVSTAFPFPKEIRTDLSLESAGGVFSGHFVRAGVPHFLMPVSDLENLDVHGMGKQLRSHPAFGAEGANINFYELLSENSVRNRTFERGVEAETPSCGSGALALSAFLHRMKAVSLPLTVHLQSGHFFEISCHKDTLFLSGSVEPLNI